MLIERLDGQSQNKPTLNSRRKMRSRSKKGRSSRTKTSSKTTVTHMVAVAIVIDVTASMMADGAREIAMAVVADAIIRTSSKTETMRPARKINAAKIPRTRKVVNSINRSQTVEIAVKINRKL